MTDGDYLLSAQDLIVNAGSNNHFCNKLKIIVLYNGPSECPCATLGTFHLSLGHTLS